MPRCLKGQIRPSLRKMENHPKTRNIFEEPMSKISRSSLERVSYLPGTVHQKSLKTYLDYSNLWYIHSNKYLSAIRFVMVDFNLLMFYWQWTWKYQTKKTIAFICNICYDRRFAGHLEATWPRLYKLVQLVTTITEW